MAYISLVELMQDERFVTILTCSLSIATTVYFFMVLSFVVFMIWVYKGKPEPNALLLGRQKYLALFEVDMDILAKEAGKNETKKIRRCNKEAIPLLINRFDELRGKDFFSEESKVILKRREKSVEFLRGFILDLQKPSTLREDLFMVFSIIKETIAKFFVLIKETPVRLNLYFLDIRKIPSDIYGYARDGDRKIFFSWFLSILRRILNKKEDRNTFSQITSFNFILKEVIKDKKIKEEGIFTKKPLIFIIKEAIKTIRKKRKGNMGIG
ncbi:MAG: hypothetical protein PHI66_01805 [Candidatus Pacebacteria bacterium]|nr:hypothetical protein [Candidatus Paceibacterota bacterium]